MRVRRPRHPRTVAMAGARCNLWAALYRQMRPLHILHVTPYFTDAWAYGGIPRLASVLARSQARRGDRVTVCTTDVSDEAARLVPSSTRSDEGVDVRVFRNVSNRLAYHAQLFMPRGLDRFLRAHAADFDVAHLHACRNVPGVIAARRLHEARVPYVLAPNGTAPRIERRRTAKRVFDLLAGRRVLRHAARVLAVSAAERAQFGEMGIHESSIRTVPNPVDLDEFSVPVVRGRFRRRFGLGGEPLVMFLGRLSPRKRVDVLIRAFARLRGRDARLIVAGNDMGAGSAWRSLVHELGLERRTLFTGLLRGRDRIDALADASVVVYPSEHEIFGLVPLEAILAGTPAIVADDCGCAEVVRSVGGGRTVPAGEPAALSAAIDQVLDSHDAWRQAAASAAVRIARQYAGDVVSSRLDEVYRELVN